MASKKAGNKEYSVDEKLQVVVVDGAPPSLERMKSTLGDWYEVLSYGRPDDFIENLDDLRPALFVLDWKMPEKDGIALSHEVRKRRRFDRIPVAFSTAAAPTREDLDQAMKAGGQTFISKEVEPGFLIAQCRVLMESSDRLSSLLRQRSMVISALKHDLLDAITGVTTGVEVLAMQKQLFKRGVEDQSERLLKGSEQLRTLVTALSDLLMTDGLDAELPVKKEPLSQLFEDLGPLSNQVGREISFHADGLETACFHRRSMVTALTATVSLLGRFVPLEIPFLLTVRPLSNGTQFEISAKGNYGKTLGEIMDAAGESPDRHDGPGLFHLMLAQSVLARHQSALMIDEKDDTTRLQFSLGERSGQARVRDGKQADTQRPPCHPELVRAR